MQIQTFQMSMESMLLCSVQKDLSLQFFGIFCNQFTCANFCLFVNDRSLSDLGCRFDGCGKYLEVELRKQGDVDDKLTVLMWAAKYDYPRFLKTLIASGAKINHENRLGETAAHHAASLGNLECLKILHSYKANFKLRNALGQSPLDKAYEQKQGHVVEWLTKMNG